MCSENKRLADDIEEKREEFVVEALCYGKSLCEELGISIESPRQIKRRHIFDDGSGDAGLSHEDELKRKMFSSVDRLIAEIQKRFQQLQNLAEKYAFIRPAIILGVDDDKCNLDHAPQDIDKEEFKLECVRLRAFVATTDCKKKLLDSGSLDLLKFIVESKLEGGLPNIVIMLRIFLTAAISNASCERSFSKLKLIKNYLRSTMSTLRLTNLSILAIEHEIQINIDEAIKEFACAKARRIKF